MLYLISWKEFFETVLIILIIYYSFVLVLYYKADLKKLLNLRSFRDMQPFSTFKKRNLNEQAFTSKLFQVQNNQEVSDFIAAVKKITREKAYLNNTKEGLLDGLHSLLSTAPPFLKTDTDFRNDINNLIVSTCFRRLANESGKEVIDSLWESPEDNDIKIN